MLKKEFEELTGIYPSDALYRCIEEKYMDMPMVRKDSFCNHYKNNTDGIAERIQMAADEAEIARNKEHEEQTTLLKKEIDSIKEELRRTKRKLYLEEEWKEYFNPELLSQEFLKCLMAPGTPAEVAALMPKFIVDLPGHDPFLSLEMFRLSPDDLL